VWAILKRAGIGPARRRCGQWWPELLRARAGGIVACDLFTVDIIVLPHI